MFEKLYLLLEKIEAGIGNRASVAIHKYETGLLLRVYWPDGFRLSHKVDAVEVSTTDEEIFVDYFIHKAKEAHPKLASLIS